MQEMIFENLKEAFEKNKWFYLGVISLVLLGVFFEMSIAFGFFFIFLFVTKTVYSFTTENVSQQKLLGYYLTSLIYLLLGGILTLAFMQITHVKAIGVPVQFYVIWVLYWLAFFFPFYFHYLKNRPILVYFLGLIIASVLTMMMAWMTALLSYLSNIHLTLVYEHFFWLHIGIALVLFVFSYFLTKKIVISS